MLSRYDAVIFDMDGLLVDTEPLWRASEQAVAAPLGLHLSNADFEASMGLRVDEVVERWASHVGGLDVEKVAAEVTQGVIDRLDQATLLPGVMAAIERVSQLPLAICSSSASVLIHAVVEHFDLQSHFVCLHSAELEAAGKPHPAAYLSTAKKLGIPAERCLAFEDSFHGAISAKAARMGVVAVPSTPHLRFGFAEAVLNSLEDFDSGVWHDLQSGIPGPSLARPRFHLAFPVHDLASARDFYIGVLGCQEGRSSATWVDFDFYGHQIVAHLAPSPTVPASQKVDGKHVPTEHFGVLLPLPTWRRLIDRLKQHHVPFTMQPTVRFAGLPGEQHTAFVLDPSGNALELKAFRDDRRVFAT